MDGVARVCKEASRAASKDGITSSTATHARAKLPRALALLSEDVKKLKDSMELAWKTLYYAPVRKLRGSTDNSSLRLVCTLFSGELLTVMTVVPQLEAQCALYIGDLHRYSGAHTELARLHYCRAVRRAPEWGQPLNQLGLLATPGLQDFRLFLRALLSADPFPSAWDNIERAIEKGKFEGLDSECIQLLSACLFQGSRLELPERCTNFFNELRASEAPSSSILRLHLLTLSLAYLSANSFEDSCRHVLIALSDCWLHVLAKIRLPDLDEATQEDEQMTRRRRERRRRGSDEESDADDKEESKLELPKSSAEERAPSRSPEEDALRSQLFWALACAAECLLVAHGVVSRITEQQRNVPRAVSEALGKLVLALCEKANLCVDELERVVDEDDGDEEIRWKIDGPLASSSSEIALRAAAFWLFKCANEEDIPIAFSTHFKLHRKTSTALPSAEELGRRMAKLRSQVSAGEDIWIPVYIVPDVSVFEKRSDVIRQLLRGEKLTVVVAGDVLHRLDKNKSKGRDIRQALRMIRLGQRSGSIRVEGREATSKKSRGADVAASGDETAKGGDQLVEAVVRTAKSLIPKDYKEKSTLVALLTMDTSLYPDEMIRGGTPSSSPLPPPPASASTTSLPTSQSGTSAASSVGPQPLVVHHIDTFRERWNKELAWRSL